MVTIRSGQFARASPRRRTFRRATGLGVLVALALVAGCGGESVSVDGDGGSAGEASGGTSSGGSGAASGGTAGFGGTSGAAQGGSSTGGTMVEPPDTDPGCPDTPVPSGTYECDVFGTSSGCGPGEGCYPTIEHPFGMGCDQQVHGSRCAFAGTSVQGEFCQGGTLDCAPGFICIVGAQSGSRCMRMCPIDGSLPCPAGLFCGETDALGVGVCA
jgi:hypothetical protein